ncbi:putative motility protein [Bacillus sp. FJAT-45066]|uniref:putative motility protein n=1 Tax=Bacillus sp. FJAT-45066 TaxID=2011010 RepID=UPI001596C928|nr:YjfB family protein [Bacillus sp. FJAT-45066]
MNIPLLSMMLSQSQVQQAASVSVMKHGLGSVEQQRKAVHKLLDSAMDRGTG